MGLLSTLTGSRPWEPPAFTQPMPTMAKDLKELGTDRAGRHWFAHRLYGEMVETDTVDERTQTLPDAVIVDIGGGRWRTMSPPSAPGTFDRLLAGWASRRQPKPPKPHRPIDGLAHLWLAAGLPETVYASARSMTTLGAVADARGPVEILDRLKGRAGVDVRLSTDRASLVVSSSGGRLGPGVLELVDRAETLLLAHLRGEPLACAVSKHKAPVPAVTVALGGAPWCGECGGAS